MNSKAQTIGRNIHPILEWAILVLLVSGYFFWLSANTVYSASANGRLVEVFEDDEYQHFVAVRNALDERSICIDWTAYGHLYFNAILWPLILVQIFTPISDQAIIVALRYGSTFFSVLTVIFTYILARRYWGRLAGWVSAISLTILPFSFNYWSVTSHPDTPQMFFIVGSLFGCCEFVIKRQERWLYVAGFIAGLAFSTKYGGLFILPIIGLLSILPPEDFSIKPNIELFQWNNLVRALRRIFLIGISFALAFLISSPCSIIGWQFIDGIVREANHVGFGHMFQSSTGNFEWFTILFSSNLLGVFSGVLVVFALGLYIGKIVHSRELTIFTPQGVLWIWVLLFFGFVFVRLNYRTDRYLFLILPFLFILSSLLIVEMVNYIKENQSLNSKFHYTVFLVIVILSGSVFYEGFGRQIELINTRIQREQNNPVIESGLWLEKNYPASTRILYDKYSYIPPKFKLVQGSYGMDETMLINFHPKLVVINIGIRGMYTNSRDAAFFGEGVEKFMDIYNFYDQMEKQELGYRLVKDFGIIRIFEKE